MTALPRVLVVHNRYQIRGGEDAVVDAEVELLRRAGAEVELASVSNDAIQGALARVRVALSVSDSSFGARWLAAEIERFRPELIHVHNFFPLLSPAIYGVAQAARIPLVQTLHNYRLTCANGLLMRAGRPCQDCVSGSPYQAVLHGC